MLITLRIENFAIVSSLTIDFLEGMTAFTGETGAGKSIMIDALMLALGGRADASVIRLGENKCDILAGFSFEDGSQPAVWLAEHEICAEDGEVFLRRIINSEGRGKSYINGVQFPLQKVRELSETLVDIHGQHQHQRLLKHQTHRDQLDHYAKHDYLLSEVAFLYQECEKIRAKQKKLSGSSINHERIALLDYQLEELSQLALLDSEVEALHTEHQRLHHAHDHLAQTQQLLNLLNGDEQASASGLLSSIMVRLATLPAKDAHVQQCVELIQSALIQCEEALDELESFGATLGMDPLRLLEIEARMSSIHSTARKHHVDAHHLHTHHQTLLDDRQRLLDLELEKQALDQQYNQQVKAYQAAALALSISRKHHADKLAEEITGTLHRLGMPNGIMLIEMSELERMQPHGMDKVEYRVCTNPGMLPDTLNKIASGGELSRISLAIQLITAQRGTTPTLLFDEVDVGIGGATAARVGRLLRQLGDRLQLFCVTHQAQVAACAHNHFRVEKESDDKQTFTRITQLVHAEKINEIARMLGGLTITEQTRNHAQELLENA